MTIVIQQTQSVHREASVLVLSHSLRVERTAVSISYSQRSICRGGGVKPPTLVTENFCLGGRL